MNTSDEYLSGSSPSLGGAGITGPRELVVRAGHIPHAQAKLLRQIQDLAIQDAALRSRRTTSEPSEGDTARIASSASELARERGAVQLWARAAGIPVEWIGRATQLGHQGIGWHEDQLLPNPITLSQRRSVDRIAHDTRHLTDMAAIAIVRDYQADRLGVLPVPEPVVAAQYSRTMHALWMRATRTGHAITIGDRARERAWGIDEQTVTGRVRGLLHLTPTEVDMLWQHYAAQGLADRLRSSLRELRHTAPQTGPDSGTSAPAPEQFLSAAREALDAVLTEQRSIGVAITDALPETSATRVWEPGTDTPTDTGPGMGPSARQHLEGGPAP
ncbi:hypothetical protein [Nocardia jiangxiensis]|uniref:hypothetical protein n=1 Tax=Nocardia jiangxiensis TaxID=282685 RepID=UPI00030BEBC0|nr:hypothetical protein [Nocardia jiangxiensis]